jgi:hypothetical protein
VRTQFARLRVNDLKFFFDAKRVLLEHKFSLSLQDQTSFELKGEKNENFKVRPLPPRPASGVRAVDD